MTVLTAAFALNQMIKIPLNLMATMLAGPVEFGSIVLIVPGLPSRFPAQIFGTGNHLGFRESPLVGPFELRTTGAPRALLQVVDLRIPGVFAAGAAAVGSCA